ncbi:hypothetical protein TOT_020000447 [Theileria orientalis strain Shintoku]|uniref:Uncharacterized protein n=1 Tax=Theileria orientalis strain Shintoku TaxID=869250 RepID=J4D7H2_THEOR|nr:hypothetical protein TOT_020000447 [Theileria orientalis strain Shintoku]BAM40185.1 hypothetical protein TOT_020000447 [Theileria orientalis strain Shintoku]|eukprot:XP_009690486.1 hypothetical protein TOT_020000447 [Theileria orientalis strain Shintoku]
MARLQWYEEKMPLHKYTYSLMPNSSLPPHRRVVTYNPKPGGWLGPVLSTRPGVPLIAPRDLNVELRVLADPRAQMQRCVYPAVCFASKHGVKR